MGDSGSGNERRLGGPERRVDALAMGVFIQALRRGATVLDAAETAGFSIQSFYRKREADPDFARAWAEALEASDAPKLIKPGNGRPMQLRRTRRLRFSAAKKEIFLAQFAGTCDLAASAEVAGICPATVRNHRLKDPEFDSACREALELGVAHLEEEAVRERLAAQERLKAGIVPAGEAATEFDRQMKLLSYWRRRDGSLGPQTHSRAALRPFSFDDAMAALEKRLKALNIPIEPPPKREGEG